MLYRFFMAMLVVLISSSPSWAQQREVRFWQGSPNPEAKSAETHLSFIRMTLVPGTVLAGQGGLLSYGFYLPPNTPLPQGAAANKLSFSEAAVLVYESPKSFEVARDSMPEYGPIHYLTDAFDRSVSCTASPRRLSDEPVSIAHCTPQDKRIAYELTANEGGEADWNSGATLVWLTLRKVDVSDSDYIASITNSLKKLSLAFSTSRLVDGHFARVGENHLIQFIHTYDVARVKVVRDLINENFANHLIGVMLDFDIQQAKPLMPFQKGWGDGTKAGSAVQLVIPPAIRAKN